MGFYDIYLQFICGSAWSQGCKRRVYVRRSWGMDSENLISSHLLNSASAGPQH